MSTDRAQLVRTALAVRRQLERRPSPPALSELPTAALARCQRQLTFVTVAERRGWPAAARSCRERLRWSLQELRRQVDASLEECKAPATATISSVRDVYEDLVALNLEFEEVAIHSKERLLAVTTEPVELDGVWLGRFSLVLEWERLHEGAGCYEVIALDPQPAASDSSVTHPHVRDGSLCEGDAWRAIRAALGAGRLLDFFTIVARTLSTYNPGSAYASVDHWAGVSCSDCGAVTDEDDRGACESCECDVCSDCSTGCNGCSRFLCGQCTGSCPACGDSYCAGCLVKCSACQEEFCGECLNDQICNKCGEAVDQEATIGQAQAHSPTAATSDPAVLALRLGEAVVSA
jgi:hypothetical protein